MNRRDFLRNCTTLATGAMFGVTAVRQLFAEGSPAPGFSLQVITDDPGTILPSLETLANNLARSGQLKFQEYRLAGEHVGDLVAIVQGQLVDFRQSDDTASKQLRAVSHAFKLPRPMRNPHVLHISDKTESTSAKRVNIYRDNVLLHQLEIGSEAAGLEVDGYVGGLAVSVKQGRVAIDRATCRHKTCMNLGAISRPGQNLVCIPNRLRIAIEGEAAHGLDAVAF